MQPSQLQFCHKVHDAFLHHALCGMMPQSALTLWHHATLWHDAVNFTLTNHMHNNPECKQITHQFTCKVHDAAGESFLLFALS